MTDTKSEAREFILVKEKLSNAALAFDLGSFIPQNWPPSSYVDTIHVIEKSAYDQLNVETARQYRDLAIKHERVLQALMIAAKRSTYEWSKGPDYFPSDYANEGRIALANEILEQTKETKNG